jgi:hypothetical protein
MEDLRPEVRDAFAKEQAKHPPAVSLRHDVVSATALNRRPQRSYQWIAVAAALAIAALVVAGLLSSRVLQRANVPGATPGVSPSPRSTDDYGPPPAGVNLIWVHDPNHPTWLDGFGWDLKVRATLKLDPEKTNVTMAPDGQAFGLGLYAKGGNWEYLDRLGNSVAAPTTLAGAINPRWADDNQHVCSIRFDQQTFEWTVWTQLPGEAPKQVSVVAQDTSIGQTGLSLEACSFKNDAAVVVRTVIASPTEYWVIRLSDGKVILHRTRTGTDVSNIVASHDGTLIALNSARSTGAVDGGASSTVVIRVSDGTVVATLDATMGVLGFSGDNSRVLVTLAPWVGGSAAHLGVVNLASGATVWQDTGSALFGGFIAEPGGSRFVLAYPTGQQGPGPATIVVVNGDGSSTALDSPYAPTW